MKRLFAAIICLCAGMLLFQIALSEGLAVPSGTLVGACYTNSGDEYGNVYSAQIGWTEDGTLDLIVEESATASLPLTFRRYSAADNTLQRIATIVNASDMTAWAERPDWLEACDASHPYLVLQVLTNDGKRINYRISGWIDFTDTESEAYRSVVAIIEESILSENLL